MILKEPGSKTCTLVHWCSCIWFCQVRVDFDHCGLWVSLGIWTSNLQACYPWLLRSQTCRVPFKWIFSNHGVFFTLWMYSWLSVQDHLLGKERNAEDLVGPLCVRGGSVTELMFSAVLKTAVDLAVISHEWIAVLLPEYNQLIKGQLS